MNNCEIKEKVKIYFEIDGERCSLEADIGDTLLDIKHKHPKILEKLECSCEGSLACSTCHVIILDKKHYDLSGEISCDEEDMLDLAYGLTETSRLGCQFSITKELEGAVFKIPLETRNFSNKKASN